MLLPLGISLSFAQQHAPFKISGEIQDAVTHSPINWVRVTLCQLDSTQVGTPTLSKFLYYVIDPNEKPFRYRKVAQYALEAPAAKTYLIHAQRAGYEDLWQRVELSDTTKESDAFDLQLRVNNPVAAYAPPIELKGFVQDAFLKRPVPNVKVQVYDLDRNPVSEEGTTRSELFSEHKGMPTEERQGYTLQVPRIRRNYFVRTSKPGYAEVWRMVSVSDTTQQQITLPVVELRKAKASELGEAVVTATRVKMYYKGDTLVYDATAFQLPDGSMLDALIKQLPGVTMNNNGEIFVHGQKIKELLLGSHSFMNGDKKVMLENLPYYTVKDIKVYDRTNDKSVALGYDIGAKDYVMDVQLKKEYRRGYIANVEGAMGTEKRWLARGFGLFFTDNWRVTLMGNLNNVSESRHIGQYGMWSPGMAPNSLKISRNAKGEVAYFSNDNKVRNSLVAEYLSTSDNQQSTRRHEQLGLNGRPNSFASDINQNEERKVSVENKLTLLKPFYLDLKLQFDHAKGHGWNRSLFEQRDDTVLIATNQSHGLNESTNWNARMEMNGAFNVGRKKYIDFSLQAGHNHYNSASAWQYTTQQFTQPATERSYNTGDNAYASTWGNFMLKHEVRFADRLRLELQNNLQFRQDKSHNYLYHPDTLMLPSELEALAALIDPNNSYDRKTWLIENTLSAKLIGRKNIQRKGHNDQLMDLWKLGFDLPVRHEELDDQRGLIDTLIHDNWIFFKPTAELTLPLGKEYRNRLYFRASYTCRPPYLNDKVNYRDDSNPLVVRLGNSQLKGYAHSFYQLSFHHTNYYGNQFNVEAQLNYHHRDVAQSTLYDPQTGVYTYQPKNVSGGYETGGSLNYENSRLVEGLKLHIGAGIQYHHSVDHAMLAGETHSRRNVVNTWTQRDNLSLNYTLRGFQASLSGDFTWRRSQGRMRDFEQLNVFDYKYGLNLQYTLPCIKTTLRADAAMYSRKGYAMASLNTDDFILNASLSQPLFKGRLLFNIEAYDILHQLSATRYEVNAQGRTETWYRTLPNYVMFHLIYRWNKNPKLK